MVQCNQLSNEQPMYELAMVFKKYLREYANKVLEFSIPKLLPSTTSIGKWLQTFYIIGNHLTHFNAYRLSL